MMRRVLPCLLLFAALLPAGLHPRLDAQPAERTHDITPEDYFSVNLVTELAVSPDGKQVAYCLATWDKKADNRRTDLWVVATDGKGKPRQLTKDRANDRHPKWSADGKSIYVLGNRKTKDDRKAITRVWKIWLDGERPPTAVTNERDNVTGFDYAPRANRIFCTFDATAIDEDDFTPLRKRFGSPQYGSGKRTVSEMYVLNWDNIPERLFAPNRYIREFAVTQDGKRIAMVSAFDDSVLKSEGESRVDVWEGDPEKADTPGKIVTPPTEVYREKAASPWAWLENLAWNPDGTRFAFCCIHDAYPAEIIIGEQKEGKWETGRMPRPDGIEVNGYGSPIRWSSAESLAFIAERRGFSNLQGFDAAKGEMHGDFAEQQAKVIYAFDVVRDANLAVTATGSTKKLADVLVWRRGDGPKPLVDPNSHSEPWKLPSVQHVTWKAPDGTTVGGPLELPHGWKKGDKPLPLVVAMHGGPTTSSKAALEFDPHNGRLYFSAAGYAVLCPNYRGSTGYGDKFVTDLIGHENDIEVKDILAGIQHLIQEGIADPERIGVMGWSNGGYLTNCLISLKDPPVKIKAASSGAGILDTVAEWGFNDEPAYPRVFKKGLPWETPEIYHRTSPTYQLANVKTPTLIHVGGNDVRCPPGHSRMLHRALKEYVKVPTELVVYPGEPHGLTKASNRLAKMKWDLAWFDKYLKGK